MLDEFKQRELENCEKEEKVQVKKKTIDLLPNADENLLKLQVRGLSVISVTKPSKYSALVETYEFLSPGYSGGQCQAGCKPGLSVGETPCATYS